MRKEIILPGAALFGGIAGFFLRRWELHSAFEAETGLAIPGAPATLALILLSFGMAAVFFLLVRGQHRAFSGGYDQAFAAKGNTVYLLAMLLSALLLLTAGLSLAVAAVGQVSAQLAVPSDQSRLQSLLAAFPQLLLALLCLGACCGVALTGKHHYRGDAGEKYSFSLLLPAYMACLWLICAYQVRAGDPVQLDYIYELLAIIFALLAFYFTAGFSFEHGKVSRTVFFSLLAVYFSFVTLADGHGLPHTALYLFVIIYLLTSTLLLLFNDRGPRVPQQEEIEPEVTPNEG
ncbi:MAG: hypothetical protein RRY65_02815 [Pseudoflavonifractor sp.]